MKRRDFLVSLGSSMGSATAWAQSPPAETAPGTPLFDGRTLDGWSVQDGPESAFYVEEGAIVGSPSSGYPAWLRSRRKYENFEIDLEFFLQGWMDGGLYFHAPEHGHRSRAGFKVSLFHQADEKPAANSMGSIYPTVAPRLVNVRNKGEWNSLRVRVAWPSLQVRVNGALVHDLDTATHPELKWKLRGGYLGLETLSYPLRFRGIRIRELPSADRWETLYGSPADLAKWAPAELHERTPARFLPLGRVLRADGLGNLATREQFRDFALRMYVRGSHHHNGGVLFRSRGGRDRYEIQLHDVEEAHYPTGSLYSYKRALYPRIESEKWFLYQMWVKDRWCLVRLNGENVMEYDALENTAAGAIEIQAHQNGRWIEYKDIQVQRL